MTTFIELREIGETIGRFASVREKADRPQDRVVIQAKDGLLKLVAGDHEKTVIATVGPTEEDGVAVVSARLLLTSLKTLKGKGDVFFVVKDNGAELRTGFGSSIVFDNIDIEPPMYLRPKPYDGGSIARFDAGWLPLASKYLSMSPGDFNPFDQVYAHTTGDDLWFKSNDNHTGVEVGPLPAEGFIDANIPVGLFPALKGLEDAGGFYFPDRTDNKAPQVQIGAGKYKVTSVLHPGAGKLPFLPKMVYNVSISADRKALAEAFKSLVGRQEFNKVTVTAGDSLVISGTQIGKVEIAATINGKGKIVVDASLMAKALSTVDGKTATVQYSDSGASLIGVSGDKYGWKVTLAPMRSK